MDVKTRFGRFQAAAAMLEVLKQLGYPASQVAKKTGVSTTTLSHWKTARSVKRKKIAPPSERNLLALNDLMVERFVENMYAVNSMLSGGYLAGLSLHQCLCDLLPHINDTQRRLRLQHENMEEYDNEFRSFFSKMISERPSEGVIRIFDHHTNRWGPSVTLKETTEDANGEILMNLFRKTCLPLNSNSSTFQNRLDETLARVKQYVDEMYGDETDDK